MNGISIRNCGFGKIGDMELHTHFAVDYRGDYYYYFVCGIT